MKPVKGGASAKKPTASTGSSIGLSILELAKMGSTRLQAALAAYDAVMKRNWQEALPEVKAHLNWSKTWQEMKEAAQGAEAEDLKALLPGFLRELGLKLPEGVLRSPRGRPGRPASEWSYLIYRFWVAMDRPKPADLAREVFDRQFTTASPLERKRMADRCAACVKRYRRKSG